MIYWGIRRDELCKTPRGCPLAVDVACKNCGAVWTPVDPRIPGPCMVCSAEEAKRVRCPDCETAKLDHALATSEAGQLIGRVLNIEAALNMHFQVTLSDVTAEEFAVLHALYIERGKQRQEEFERQEREARRNGPKG